MQNRNAMLSFFAITILSATGFSASVSAASDEASHAMTADMKTHMIASGSWVKKLFKPSGTWSIYEEGGKNYVKLSSEFKTRNGPDLKLFLSPLSAANATGDNATDGSILISPLRSNSGEQVYEIPESVNLTAYQSILIHCEAYSKLWSAADL